MMKKLLHSITLVLLITGFNCNAQWQNGLWTGKQAYNWYFGGNAGLNFETVPPTVLDGQIEIAGGMGAISDSNGNLLFYTDGNTVWNMNHEIMENGEGLYSSALHAQTGLIVPVPNNPNKFYIFGLENNEEDVIPEINALTPALYYSEIDMSLDGGLGAVTENKNILLLIPLSGSITAVHHADGEKIWVICQRGDDEYPSDEFVAYLISEDGINPEPIVSYTGFMENSGYSGQLKASPDGSKLAIGGWGSLFGSNYSCKILDFNPETGEVTNPIDLSGLVTFVGNGIEFSPNGRFLYVIDAGMSLFPTKIVQADLDAGNQEEILASAIIFQDSFMPFHTTLQVGPDGKIYAAIGASFDGSIVSEALSVINFPNNSGTAAGFEQETIDTEGNDSSWSLPGFIQSYFESGILHEGLYCPGNDISFSTIRIPGIESIVWDFGDPNSGDNNTATDLEPVHAFSGPGVFTVTAIITSNGAEQTASTQVIIIAPAATIPSVENSTLCADASGSAAFNLTNFDSEILGGQDVAVYTVTYYASEEDVAADTPIETAENFITSGQVVFAKVTSSETTCYTVIEFPLVVNPLPQVTAPVVAAGCANADGAVVFDLTSHITTILDVQNPEDFTVVFYASESDMESNTPIAAPEGFSTGGQMVYALVINAISGCEASIAFELVVTPLPVADELEDVAVCDSYTLPALSANNAYWTGTGGTGEQLPVGHIINETVTLYVVATSSENTNCTAESDFEVVVNPTPVFDLGGPYYSCIEGGTVITVTSENFDLEGAEYAWTFNGEAIEADGAEVVANGFGIYRVTITVNGCSSINEVEVIDSSISEIAFESGCVGFEFWLKAVPVNDSFNPNTAEYVWTAPGFTSSEQAFVVPVPGEYQVVVTNENGCSLEGSVIVEGTTCFVPRGISPNGDGMNDNFDLLSYNVRKLSIFNRYGQEVYSRTNYTNEWKGQSNNGNELPTGTYYYMMERENGESKTGWVYINREE